MIARSAVDAVREAAIAPVLEALGAVAVGRRWRCFNAAAHKHGDRKPSGTVHGARYRCWTCGAAGDAIALLAEARGLSFREALAEAARLAGVPSPAADEAPEASHARRLERDVDRVLDTLATRWAADPRAAGAAAAYLKGAAPRRVAWVVDRCRLGYAGGDAEEVVAALGAIVDGERRAAALEAAGVAAGGAPTPAFALMCRGGLAIPITVAGRVHSFIVRRPRGAVPKALCLPRRGRVAWGLGERPAARAVVLVEGEGDRLALLAGAPAWIEPVAAGLWIAGEGADDVRRALAAEMRRRRVFIGYDDDDAGRAGAAALAAALPGAYAVRWGAKDPRDALAAGVRLSAALGAPLTLGDLPAPTPRVWPASPDETAQIDAAGVRILARGKWGTVAPAPIWPAWAARDAETGEMRLGVAWARGGRVSTAELRRADALGAGLAALGDRGAPVALSNLKGLSSWLLAAEAGWRLPTVPTASRAGWIGATLAIGRRCVGRPLRVWSDSDEKNRLLGALGGAGDERRWREAMNETLAASPAAAFSVYSAAASPFLKRLGAPPFILHLWGRSSRGKTTTARAALAWWGDPEALTMSWKIKEARFEIMAATLSAFPFLLDEIEEQRDRDLVERIIYAVGNGRGGGRAVWRHGKVDMSETARWCLVVLSTGEESLVVGRAKEGQAARAIQLFGSPFGDARGADVERINEIIRDHHGHGAAWAARAATIDWTPRVEEMKRCLGGAAEGVERRLVAMVAAVAAVGATVEEHLGNDTGAAARAAVEVMRAVRDDLGEEASYSDRALAAVASWIAEQRERFSDHPPPAGRLGLMFADRVAILPRALDELLRREGFEPRTVLYRWRTEGVLYGDDGHSTKKERVDGERVRAVVLPLDRIAPLLEAVRPPPPPAAPDA